MKDESGKLILNVDDDLARLHANSRLLLENDYQIIETPYSHDVLRLAVKKKPAVILLHANNFELIRQIKNESLLAQTYVLQVLDAESNAEIIGDVFLKEPYSAEELTAQLKILLRLREAQRKTSSQQDLIQNVTKAVPSVFYIHNAVTCRIEYLTAYATEILGYAPSEIQEFDQSFIESSIHREDLSKIAEHFQKLGRAGDGEILTTEYRIRHKSGEWLWFESRDRVMNRTPDGLPERIFGIASDITLQKQLHSRNLVQYEIARILTSVKTMNEATPKILETICREMNFELGELWCFDKEERILRFDNAWHLPLPKLEKFVAESRYLEFRKSEGLPGKVWQKRMPLWIEDLLSSSHFPLKSLIKKTNLQSGFAFPILLGEKLLGVFSFFSFKMREPNEPLLQMLAVAGNHIGQFIKRQNTEEKLRESEARYRIVAETASDGIISIDEDSTILFANPATEKIFGYKVKEIVGQKLTMIMPEHLRDADISSIESYLETGSSRHLDWSRVEVIGLHCNGHQFPLELSIGEYNHGGKRVFIGIARDITKRKRTEQALLERESLALLNSEISAALIENNFLQDILRACSEVIVKRLDVAFARIWTLNKEENVLELQASAGIYTNLDGAHARVPVGKLKIGMIAEERKPHLTNSVVGDARVSDQQWAKREGMIAFAGYPLIVEERLVGVIATFARRPLTDETLDVLASVTNTIALGIERKRSEEAMRESEERFRRVADSAPVMIWIAGVDKSCNFFNKGWLDFTGRKMTEECGNGWTEGIHPEDYERCLKTYTEAFDARQPFEMEYRLRRFDGKYRWILDKGLPLFSPDETFMGYIGSCLDIQERKGIEAERERLLAGEQRAREAAELANRSKDEFIAVVSHELRSPLNAMLGWARILQNKHIEEVNVEHALDTIVRNARTQSKLIEDLLDTARISSGKLRLEMEPVNLSQVIETVLDIAQPMAQAKEITINQNLDARANFVTGDADRLQQIFGNLLFNAIKFTPEGGRINVSLNNENQNAVFVIKDSGCGISAEFLPRIFDQFTQSDPASTRRHGGLGIGLALARNLVEMHDGTIKAESPGIGCGSTFTVNLPLRLTLPFIDNINSDEIKTMSIQGKLNNYWILIVDDEADARDMVSFMLQINGARVTTAKSAVEALDVLKNIGEHQATPNVIISDIGMPNEDGYALIQKIRALPIAQGSKIPAIALTAFNRPEDKQNALEAGFQLHLGKPIEPENLVAAVSRVANSEIR